ncbi:JmjC domain protein [Oesophagostomum dentatum]|uniref:JmjC domain protein n=1 Tax=Oesophagostomum dentatum TaxID=61180 RepID=A0A0B1T9H8_OESDE|nr:JmjC domain protein [Oesophagostomum dentatum]
MLLLVFVCVLPSFKVVANDNGGWYTEEKYVVGKDGPCNIERHDANDLTEEEFLKRFAYAEPVVIYNIDNSEFGKRTTKQKMLEDWENTPVTLNSANTYSYTRVPTTFGEYLTHRLKPQNLHTLGNETMYLFGDIDRKLWAPLLSTYRIPKWTLPGHEPALSFGIAGAGTGVPFHFHGPVFAEVIYGSKRWFVYPFEERPEFEPDHSTLEWFLKSYDSIPREKRPLECVVKPGEAIYLPDKWWHATLNTETSVFISTFLSP